MIVTAVIPAHNEEKTIGNVIKEIKKVKEIKKMIVVDDGSSDKTHEEASIQKVKIIKLKTKHGKSNAIKKVCKNIKADVVFFCDADLTGLKKEHVKNIIDPVVSGQAVMSLGIRANSVPGSKLTGERAITNSVFQKIMRSENFDNWGMEIVMNKYCKVNNLPVKIVKQNYIHTYQPRKRGLKGYISLISQFVNFTKTRIKLLKDPILISEHS